MIICDFDAMCVVICPNEADSPVFVDPDRMLAFAPPLISRRPNLIEEDELTKRDSFDRLELLHEPPLEVR